MKSKVKSKIIILFTIGIFFALIPIIAPNLSHITGNSSRISDYQDDSSFDKKNLKISEISGKIHINNNWTAAKSVGICTGSGTYSEPYVIEDLIIDGGGSGSCIKIENSDVYFKIENCTVYNGGGDDGDAGIHLYNVTHALLFNNTCSDSVSMQSHFYGILLLESYNNTIMGNIVTQNIVMGIGGITVSMSNNINLTENIVNDGGIRLIQTNNSIASGNIVNVYSIDGLLLSYCTNTTVSGNNVNNRRLGPFEAGIKLEYSDYNNISKNTAKQRIDCMIGKHNTISGNIINNNNYGPGIYLRYIDNNTVSGNTANNNSGPGIYLYDSYNNTIVENTANDNGEEGIRISLSDSNQILRNTLNNNTVGISFYRDWLPPVGGDYSDYNRVVGNVITNNSQFGIWVQEDSDFNLIFNNTFIGNSLHAFDNGTGNQWISPDKIIYTYEGNNYTNYFGNYWDNYTGNDANNDGIGDTAFILNEVIDNYPLMEPIENYRFIGIYEPPEASEKEIPGYNIFILLGIVSIAAILITKKVKKS